MIRSQDDFTQIDQLRNELVEALGDAPLSHPESILIVAVLDGSPGVMQALTRLVHAVRLDERQREASTDARPGQAWLSSLRREAARSTWSERAAGDQTST